MHATGIKLVLVGALRMLSHSWRTCPSYCTLARPYAHKCDMFHSLVLHSKNVIVSFCFECQKFERDHVLRITGFNTLLRAPSYTPLVIHPCTHAVMSFLFMQCVCSLLYTPVHMQWRHFSSCSVFAPCYTPLYTCNYVIPLQKPDPQCVDSCRFYKSVLVSTYFADNCGVSHW